MRKTMGNLKRKLQLSRSQKTKYLFMASGVILTDYVSHKEDMKEEVEAEEVSTEE